MGNSDLKNKQNKHPSRTFQDPDLQAFSDQDYTQLHTKLFGLVSVPQVAVFIPLQALKKCRKLELGIQELAGGQMKQRLDTHQTVLVRKARSLSYTGLLQATILDIFEAP